MTKDVTTDSATDFDFLSLPDVLVTKVRAADALESKMIPIYVVECSQFKKSTSKFADHVRAQIEQQKWTAKDKSFIKIIGQDGLLEMILLGYEQKIGLYTICAAAESLINITDIFELKTTGLSDQDHHHLVCGWILSCYRFTHFKKDDRTLPRLKISQKIDFSCAIAYARAAYLVRNLINLPPNALGPQTLAQCAAKLAQNFDASCSIISGEDLLHHNFPLIYAVGQGSLRPPALAEITWGNQDHPHVTLVGKGICFDTGGLNIKTGDSMLLMKKDMSGAAMALATALILMSLNTPIYLRILIPCAENSVSGAAFRPSDILTSRNGKTIEIGNTDAEGRLVVADALAYACEDTPELLIDFTTLTGAAHYGVGYDMGSLFSSNDELAKEIERMALELDDPLWHMPLWQGYKKDVTSPIADLNNTGGGNPAGAITAALFLQHFVTPQTDWVHIDERAWQSAAQPGRSVGGREMGVRAISSYILKKYKFKDD